MSFSKARDNSVQVILAGLGFWFCAWLGTVVAGGVFGGAMSLIDAMAQSHRKNPDVTLLIQGLTFGLFWAGSFGAVIIPHFAIFCWMFWMRENPLHRGAIAGGLVGAVSGLIYMPITAPMGWLGAFLAVRAYLRTRLGKRFAESTIHTGKLRFSVRDVFLRVTVVAIVIGLWTSVYRYHQQPRQQSFEEIAATLGLGDSRDGNPDAQTFETGYSIEDGFYEGAPR